MKNLIIEKLKKEDLKEAISIYDTNHNLKTNYDKLFKELTKKGRIFLWTNSSLSVFLF